MSTIQERIRELRESTGMGRTLFARHVGIKERTLISIEREGKKPGADILAAIAHEYPQHVVWLLTGVTDPAGGHISPEIETTTKALDKGKAAGKSQQ